MLQSSQTTLLSFYTFLMFNFSYCTFSLPQIYYNVLFLCHILPYCTYFMLHFQGLFFYLALFNCCTFIMSKFFLAALFHVGIISCCIFSDGTNICINLHRYFTKVKHEQFNSNSHVDRHFQNGYPETLPQKVRRAVGTRFLSTSLVFSR